MYKQCSLYPKAGQAKAGWLGSSIPCQRPPGHTGAIGSVSRSPLGSLFWYWSITAVYLGLFCSPRKKKNHLYDPPEQDWPQQLLVQGWWLKFGCLSAGWRCPSPASSFRDDNLVTSVAKYTCREVAHTCFHSLDVHTHADLKNRAFSRCVHWLQRNISL